MVLHTLYTSRGGRWRAVLFDFCGLPLRCYSRHANLNQLQEKLSSKLCRYINCHLLHLLSWSTSSELRFSAATECQLVYLYRYGKPCTCTMIFISFYVWPIAPVDLFGGTYHPCPLWLRQLFVVGPSCFAHSAPHNSSLIFSSRESRVRADKWSSGLHVGSLSPLGDE